MTRNIVFYGDPVLRKKCKPISSVDGEIKSLADEMLETMKEADGIGLAAPQIGVPIQLAVVDISEDPDSVTFVHVDEKPCALLDIMPLVFINPKLEPFGSKASSQEGCLSIPGISARVRRAEKLKAELELLDGRKILLETDGLLARVIQHEVDHLNGILFLDRLPAAQRILLQGKLKKMFPGSKKS